MATRGGKSSRGGGASSRGWMPGQTDKLAETGKELGIVNLSQAQVDRPLPLFPERQLRRFQWSDADGSELFRVRKASPNTFLVRFESAVCDRQNILSRKRGWCVQGTLSYQHLVISQVLLGSGLRSFG